MEDDVGIGQETRMENVIGCSKEEYKEALEKVGNKSLAATTNQAAPKRLRRDPRCRD